MNELIVIMLYAEHMSCRCFCCKEKFSVDFNVVLLSWFLTCSVTC